MNINLKRFITICLMVAFCFVMADKMFAETSNWAKYSNKHYNISKINSINFFKVQQPLKSSFSLFIEKKHIENILLDIHYPTKFTKKLYILYCELDFDIKRVADLQDCKQPLRIPQYIL
ncbi:MAG: hypothetical protein A2X64_02005 [Ignavibacteria bacterium GWF2_33_9]|nr:MAG: hypothetical protein A2X64_02005 [Ignavibacteria bacterium GWF2_33_9]